MDLNKVMLIGRLGKDPEFYNMRNNQGELCKFSIATSRKWKDKRTGERKEDTAWHSIVVFNEFIINNVCHAMLRKGTYVFIEGELKTRKYDDKDGGKPRYITEILVSGYKGEINVLSDGKMSDVNENPGANRQGGGSGGLEPFKATNMLGQTPSEVDDDIPF